jgi:hypothetical protein
VRTDGYLPAGRGAPAQPLAREQVAAMLAGIESSTALGSQLGRATVDRCRAGRRSLTRGERD